LVDEGDGPSGRPLHRRRLRGTAALLVALLCLGACSSGREQHGGGPTATPTISGRVLALGKRGSTAKGTIVAYAYEANVTDGATPDPDTKFVAVDVEACGGPKADAHTGIQPEAFYLQVGTAAYHPLTTGVRAPALHQTVLAPGRCARGWVTFQIPIAQKPQYLFVRTTPRIAWKLPG